MKIILSLLFAICGVGIILVISTLKSMIDAHQRWLEEHDDFINQ